MNVHVMDTPFLLPKPDLDVLVANRAQLRRYTEALGEIHLPVKREKLLSLIEELSHVDKQVLDILTLGPGLLANHGLPDLLETIAKLKQQPLTDETGSHIEVIVKEIREERFKTLAELQLQSSALDDALVNFSAVSVSDVDHFVVEIEASLTQVDEQIAAENQPLGKWLEEEAALNKLIAEVEALSALDKFKPLVASLDKLIEIDPNNRLVGSIKAGIAGMSSILDLANDALEYKHLLKHRERLQELLDALRGHARELHEKRKAEARKLEQFRQLQALEELKSAYSQEVARLLAALNGFLTANRIEAVDSVEAQTALFIRHARFLSNYLTELRRDWRS
ncbi:alpha-xenorhabdolysin family binary toxin subunit B [Pseudomonas sp. 21LCFQ02]|uniref:alpha-xenorhabdolysin family binary toxin subunit B n=1 Tax=unclassified Pseudomonas TaxID=196821 RepID=UPI00209740E7|nr:MULTISPECIES: alpha-xenorhabdolysin family binary toxin subunit B [unclassified Pseudomonas]MCO8162919.1 alpha-xenorhabdolysin family binary toxin subunit B [Pseudomonas sp. 21LCFQ010]MCO8170835.1 alpha-xenorhabdolysin family binary toxin subunit B [Pseudomonas sp. 21LCFQ02]MCQ9424568.1 alpha-xenorhabdolysin family binary toxin subunit B [Pseudomonas sp. LJDD11]